MNVHGLLVLACMVCYYYLVAMSVWRIARKGKQNEKIKMVDSYTRMMMMMPLMIFFLCTTLLKLSTADARHVESAN